MTNAVDPPRPRPGDAAGLAGASVARIGYGAMQLERHRDDPDAGSAVLRRALERGVDHVDTAQFYGNGFVNDLIRRTAASECALIASKVGATPDPDGPFPLRPAQRPEQLRASVEDNLRSLGLETVPLVHLRRLEVGPGLAAQGDQIVGIDDQLAEMIALREEGKIGAIGLSAVTIETLRHAMPAGIASVQNPYNLIDRRFEDMLDLCTHRAIAWVPFFPLGSAFPGMAKVTEEGTVHRIARELGATPSQIGLAWLLNHAPNVLLIPGTASLGHLEENLDAAAVQLDTAAVAALDAVGVASVSTPIAPPSWPSGPSRDSQDS